MSVYMRAWKAVFVLLVAAALAHGQKLKDRELATAASVLPPGLRNVTLEQRLNQQIPLDLSFRDDTGPQMPLSSYFSGKPVILALVYYQCPMLCTQILNGLVISLRGMSLESGRDFEVMAVSIDPTETPDLAARKKAEYLHRYAKSSAGWHFLTGAEPQIRQELAQIPFILDLAQEPAQGMPLPRARRQPVHLRFLQLPLHHFDCRRTLPHGAEINIEGTHAIKRPERADAVAQSTE